jgi:hypothetical protein
MKPDLLTYPPSETETAVVSTVETETPTTVAQFIQPSSSAPRFEPGVTAFGGSVVPTEQTNPGIDDDDPSPIRVVGFEQPGLLESWYAEDE